MPNVGVALAGAAIGSAVIGSSASSKAADATADAAENATEMSVKEQRRQFDKMLEITAPWRETGAQSLNQLSSVLGLGTYQLKEGATGGGLASAASGGAAGGVPASGNNLPGGSLTQPYAGGTVATPAAPTTPAATQTAAPAAPIRIPYYKNVQKFVPINEGDSMAIQGGTLKVTRVLAGYTEVPAGAPPELFQGKQTIEEMNNSYKLWKKGKLPPQAEALLEAKQPGSSSPETYTGPNATPGAGTVSQYEWVPGSGEVDTNMLRNLPGYQFAVGEGQQGIDRTSAARGMTRSGAYDKATMRFRQGLADQNYLNYLNPYFQLAGLGQTSASQAAGGAQNMGNNVSQMYMQQGNVTGQANASNYANQANIYGNLLNNLAGGYAAYKMGT